MVHRVTGTMLAVLMLAGLLTGAAGATPLNEVPAKPESPAVCEAAERLAKAYRDYDALDASAGTVIYRIGDTHVLTQEEADNYIDRITLHNELTRVYAEQMEEITDEAQASMEDALSNQAEISRDDHIDELLTQLMMDAEAARLGIQPDEALAQADMEEMLAYAQQGLDDPMADIYYPDSHIVQATQDAFLWALGMSYEQYLEKYFMPLRRRASTWALAEQAYLDSQGAGDAEGKESVELLTDYYDQLRVKYLQGQEEAPDASE